VITAFEGDTATLTGSIGEFIVLGHEPSVNGSVIVLAHPDYPDRELYRVPPWLIGKVTMKPLL